MRRRGERCGGTWVTKEKKKHVPKKMRTAVLNVLNLFDWNTSNAGTATAQRWQETMKDIALMAKDAEALEHMGAGAGDYADFDPSLPGYIDTLLQQTGGKTGIGQFSGEQMRQDRKSTRLNSSHKTESRMPSSA